MGLHEPDASGIGTAVATTSDGGEGDDVVSGDTLRTDRSAIRGPAVLAQPGVGVERLQDDDGDLGIPNNFLVAPPQISRTSGAKLCSWPRLTPETGANQGASPSVRRTRRRVASGSYSSEPSARNGG